MGDDRESHLNEIRGHVRERAQLFEAFGPRTPPQFLDDQRADTVPALARIDRQRADFGDVGAERRELGAADDTASPRRDDESRGVIVNRTAETVVRLLPPLVITEPEIDEALGRLDAAFGAVGADE